MKTLCKIIKYYANQSFPACVNGLFDPGPDYIKMNHKGPII